MGEYRQESWAFKATFWRDSAWKRSFATGSPLYSLRPLRSRAGRWNRWEDEIVEQAGDNWVTGAADREQWSDKACEFADARFK